MPKPTKGPRLGGSPTHERMMLANMATQLFEHGRITTTVTRAKRLQPLAEKLIAKAKRGDLHSRRLVMQTIKDKTVVHVLFEQIAPELEGRDGGCTRITKVGNRKGDNAPMAVIEIVTEELKPRAKSKRSDSARRTRAKDTKPVETDEEIISDEDEVDEPGDLEVESESDLDEEDSGEDDSDEESDDDDDSDDDDESDEDEDDGDESDDAK